MKILNYKNFLLINEEINFNIIPCAYTYSITPNPYVKIDTFTFITRKGNSYSVYINNTYEPNFTLEDGTKLHNYSKGYYIPTIYFSLTSNGVNSPYFNNLTNLGESLEVMGKVCFIINEYIINNSKYKVYSIGGVEESKLGFYKNWLSKLNITKYIPGPSNTYLVNNLPSIAYYLIK